MTGEILRGVALPGPGFSRLATEARGEGHRFIDRLWSEWESGRNRFAGAGETLCGIACDGGLIAIGGLNSDPYADPANVGRLRHFFVAGRFRRCGLGSALLAAIVADAAARFTRVRLRTDSRDAALFYESNGFSAVTEPFATHVFEITAMPANSHSI